MSKTKRMSGSDQLLNTELESADTTMPVSPNSSLRSVEGIIDLEGDLFYRSGVRKKTVKDLKRGKLVPDAEIDLHGCTRREALDYLQIFFAECRRENANCVRVITGKGRGSPGQHSVIRETTLAWLRQRSEVHAYCTALPSEGGTGAFYVLLSP